MHHALPENSARAMLASFGRGRRRSSSPYLFSILLVVAPCSWPKSASPRHAGSFQTERLRLPKIIKPIRQPIAHGKLQVHVFALWLGHRHFGIDRTGISKG